MVGAALMVAAGLVELFFGIKAERQSLESVAKPLSAVAAEASGYPVGQMGLAPTA